MSLGINLGAQNLGPNSWTYFSPIFLNLITVYLSSIYPKSIVILNLSWIYRGHVPDVSNWRIIFMKNMEIGLNRIHMGRYELILRLDGALWLTVISKPPLTPRRAIQIQNCQKKQFFFLSRGGHHPVDQQERYVIDRHHSTNVHDGTKNLNL